MPYLPTRVELRAFAGQYAAVGLRQSPHVHIWTLKLQASQEAVCRFQAILSPDELERAARFRFEHLRTSFVLTRGALRTILGLYLDTAAEAVSFTYGTNGKPALNSCDLLEFNTSHSGDLSVFAVTSGCELGLDIEKMRAIKNMQDIANRFFCPEEAAQLMSLPGEQRERAFFLCWTRKEAYIKATGQGLSAPLDSFRVSLDPGQPAKLIHLKGSAEAAQQWMLHSLEIAWDYTTSLAYCDRERPVTLLPLLHPNELLRL